jgi:hypothetical protein
VAKAKGKVNMYVKHVNKFKDFKGVSYWDLVAKMDNLEALRSRDRMLRKVFNVSTWADIAFEMDEQIKIESNLTRSNVGLDGVTKSIVNEAARVNIKSKDFLAVYSDSTGDMDKVAAHFKIDLDCAKEQLVILKNIGHDIPRFRNGQAQSARISLANLANLAGLVGLKKVGKEEPKEEDKNADSLSMREEMSDMDKIAAMAGLRKLED